VIGRYEKTGTPSGRGVLTRGNWLHQTADSITVQARGEQDPSQGKSFILTCMAVSKDPAAT
jgi:hypothetical protein